MGAIDDDEGRPRILDRENLISVTLTPQPAKYVVTHRSSRLLADHLKIGYATVATIWWNPLRAIETIMDARKLASYFAAASKDDSARVDAYFDGGAQELLAQMMLAAACADGDLLHVYGWLSDEANELPQRLLEVHGHHIIANRLKSSSELNPRQRDGLYDMARRFIGLLEEQAYAMSVLPPNRRDISVEGAPDTKVGGSVREFVVEDFVTSTDTLYALSKEGPDSSSALTTALIGSIIDAAQRVARRSPRGRLPVPMLGVLDEAANVCRLPELPAWYSHLGSQGCNQQR
ncbi:type IV secretory system conjugative DNA transfer family protein [Rhodococcus sp. IEGM 1381]|uniref:type IV secretory system conjugative DNA transfer family protein n=1 Tax=Rhodococcus sp. IEGM 1381 TaxID=3047085 RepID=UPI0024B7B64C|nr:type IV secretory system conjugative DNA transfer family protein [Rhodococcus sp. IEGM 1381]MDI9894148.1 type IV secretory system conjugative DNA transfer family protein [Rhodococcus sp. IEGM 1381]